MILLAILCITAWIILPLMLALWLLEKNDYMLFRWDIDVHLFGVGIVFIEVDILIQFIDWMYPDII